MSRKVQVINKGQQSDSNAVPSLEQPQLRCVEPDGDACIISTLSI